MEKKKHLKARASVFRNAMRNEPLLFAHLADCYLQMGMHPKAAELLLKGLEKYPDYEVAWIVKGNLHLQLDQNKEARQSFEKALSIDGNIPYAHEKCDEIAHEERDIDGSVWHLRELLRLDPVSENVRSMLEGALLRQVAVQNHLYSKDRVYHLMPNELRQELSDHEMLPEELDSRHQRIPVIPRTYVPSEELPANEEVVDDVVKTEIVDEEEEKEQAFDDNSVIDQDDFFSEEVTPTENLGIETESRSQGEGNGSSESSMQDEVQLSDLEQIQDKINGDMKLEKPFSWREVISPEQSSQKEEGSAGELNGEETDTDSPHESGTDLDSEADFSADKPPPNDGDDAGDITEVENSTDLGYQHNGDQDKNEDFDVSHTESPQSSKPKKPFSWSDMLSSEQENREQDLSEEMLTEDTDKSPLLSEPASELDIERDVEEVSEEILVEDRDSGSHDESDYQVDQSAERKPYSWAKTLGTEDQDGSFEETQISEQSPEDLKPISPPEPTDQEVSSVSDPDFTQPEYAKETEDDVWTEKEFDPYDLPEQDKQELEHQEDDAHRELTEAISEVTGESAAASGKTIKKSESQTESDTAAKTEKPKERIATKTLAELHASQGDWARAVEVYQELSESQPDNQVFQQRLKVLKMRLKQEENNM